MKRFTLVFMLCLCLIGTALAAPGDADGTGAYRAMAVMEDAVYLLDEENQLFALQAGGAMPDAPLVTLSAEVDFLISSGSKLYGWETSSGILYEIALPGGELTQAAALPTDDLFKTRTPDLAVEFLTPVLQDGMLYVIVQGDEIRLVRFDLDLAGGRTETTLPGHSAFLAAGDHGEPLLYSQTEDGRFALYTIPQKGEPSLLRTLPQSAWAIASKGGVLYVGADNRIEKHENLKAQTGEIAVYLPVSPYAAQTAVTDNGYFALLSDGGTFHLRNLDPHYRASRSLTLGWNPDSSVPGADDAFRAAYPDVALQYASVYLSTSEEYHTYLATGSGADLLMAETQYDPWLFLRDKGYAADLSQSQTLWDTVNAMYPALQEAVTREGRLFGLPVSFWESGFIQIARDTLVTDYGFLHELLPETLMDIPAFLQIWMDNFMEEYPDTVLMGDRASNTYVLREVFCRQYEAYCAAQGLPLAFDTPLFRSGLQMLKSLPDTKSSDRIGVSSLMIHSVGDLRPYNNNGSSLVPLPMNGAVPYYLPVTPALLFINPGSENFDLALQYLEISAQHLPAIEKILLMPGENEPVPNPKHGEELERTQKNLAEAQAALNKAELEKRKLLEDRVEDSRRMYEFTATHGQWLVSPEWIAAYRKLAENMTVLSRGFFDHNPDQPELFENINQLQKRYDAGQITEDQFIAELDRIARMMAMEAE